MNKVKLGDIADIITGPFGSMLHKSDYVEDGTPVIMPQDIGDRTISFEGIARVGTDDAERLSRYATIAEDIVYARRGDVEKHAFITKDQAGALCGTGCLRVRIDPEKANPLYVSFALKELSSCVWIRRHAVGSNMPNINTDILSDLPLDLPNLEEQRLVADALSALDDKIALNKKMMAELEKTARLIYDYWFMQFDFPDENGRPYRSSGGRMVYSETLKRDIPAGWEVASVNELAHVEKGISYKADDLKGPGVPMINLASFNTDGTYKSEGLKTFSGNIDLRKTASPFDLVMCITQQTAIDLSGRTNVVGKAFFVPDVFGETAVISTDVCKLEVREDAYAYLLNGFFKRPEVHKHIVGFANGTKIKHLDTVGAFEMRLPIPPIGSYVLEDYREKARQLEEQKSNLLKESFQLFSLRDWLLPMLMNGQVTVCD